MWKIRIWYTEKVSHTKGGGGQILEQIAQSAFEIFTFGDAQNSTVSE